MKRFAFLFVAMLALVPGALPAAPTNDAPSMDSLRQSYEQSVQKQQIGSGATLLGKQDEYMKALTALADKLQKAGDLDGLLAVQQEKERFAKDKQVPRQPAADTPATIAKLQTDYRNSISQVETDKCNGLLALTEKYVAQLNALKKQLTVQGDIEEALKMKAEVDRVKASAPVAAAEFALAELGTKTAAATSPGGAPAGEVQDTRPCTHCDGTGRVIPDCPKCHGSGQCAICGGRGMVPAALKGTKGNVRCMNCMGTGKCRSCSDPSKQAACTFCGGTGKVATPVPRKEKLPPPSPVEVAMVTPPQGGPPDSAVKRLADAELDKYLEAMSTLHKQFQSGTVTTIEADKVFASPLTYTGKILQSKVYLMSGHSRGVKVAASYDAIPKGGNLLIPYSMDVGNKADSTAKAVGANGQVVITYGVVNKDNITLFAVSR